MASNGAETWILRKVGQKCLESFEKWCWRRMERISWTDRVKNREVLIRFEMKGKSYLKQKEGRLIILFRPCVETDF
jgi:hypothetical protein